MHSLILYGEIDVSWAPVFPVVLDTYTKRGNEVKILDVSYFSYPKFRSPKDWILKRYGLNSSHWALEDARAIHSVQTLTRRKKNRLSQTILHPDEEAELEKSIDGLLMTLFADFRPQRHGLLYKAIREIARKRTRLLFHSFYEHILADPPNEIAIPNGRFPNQKVLALVAKRLGIAVEFYERGFRPDSGVFLGKHMTVDRVAWQARAKDRQGSLDDDLRSSSKEWLLSRRQPGSLENEFSAKWSDDATQAEYFGTKKPAYSVAFFTSSQDEFLALEDWQGFGWSDQYEAFVEFANNVQGPTVLRIHPNFINKSFRHAIDEIRRIFWMRAKLPQLEVVWPTSPLNSYEILERSNRVVVYGSTIGLEASAIGKPVWNAGNSFYDIVGDVKNFFPKTNYPAEYFQEWEVDTSRSWAIIDAQIAADIAIPDRLLQRRWNAQSIPFLVRLINFSTSGFGLYSIILIKRSIAIRLNKALVYLASLMASRSS
jgi:hypothetical protein